MIFKYIVGIIIGYIMSTILSIVMTVLRFGIPECNQRLKTETDNITILALKELKKRYKISILIWTPILILVSLCCYFWLKSAFIGYLIGLFINIFLIIKKSGKTTDNLLEFENSLKANTSFIIDKEASK